MNTQEFLETVITTPSGYLELGVRNGVYKQHWYEWPTQLPEILDHALNADGDVYFSAHLFQTKNSHKENVLPSRTIQADLDDADVSALPLSPSILVSTSPLRHQGFWVASSDFDSLQVQELISKKLSYSIPLCDRSGWPLGHKVRLPDTKNYKYKNGPHPVQILKATPRLFSIDELELLPDLALTMNPTIPNGEFIDNPPQTSKSGAYELVESIKDHLSAKVYAEYMQDSPATDRSRALFSLMLQCFRAGLPRDDVYWVAYNSPNNKFRQDLRFNDKRELAKDVIRAEHEVKSVSINLREMINDIRRKSKVLAAERMRTIYEMIESAMKASGEFVHVTDGRRYYIPTETGRPVDMDQMEEELHNLLDIKYSLNRTEREHSYTISSLCAYVGTLPETYKVGVLARYDHPSKTVLVHSGRKDIYAVTPSGISCVPNGSYNTVFPWDRIIEPFTPIYDPEFDWAQLLFTLPNVVNMSQDEAKCVLKTWVLFAMLRDMAASRPILSFMGQPGSGKTSTAKRIYAFMYGKHMNVSGATNPVNYDIATASLPFYVLDNLDTWEKWIPDRLAQSAGDTDVLVRKLYTNAEVIRIKRQAMVAVTAHDPKFGRADVTDRMLIISLARFSNVGIKFDDEGAMLHSVLRNRNKIWGGILLDLQRIVSTPFPTTTNLQLRVQDFARVGEWINVALGQEELFARSVQSLQAAQRTFNLDEDHILVTAMSKWLSKQTGKVRELTQEELYQEVILCVPTDDFKTFVTLYKNSGGFVRRLSTLQDTLNSTLFTVEFHLNKKGERVWTVVPRQD